MVESVKHQKKRIQGKLGWCEPPSPHYFATFCTSFFVSQKSNLGPKERVIQICYDTIDITCPIVGVVEKIEENGVRQISDRLCTFWCKIYIRIFPGRRT